MVAHEILSPWVSTTISYLLAYESDVAAAKQDVWNWHLACFPVRQDQLTGSCLTTTPMTPLETAELLTAEFPELTHALHLPKMSTSIYRQLDCFAAFTRRAVDAGHLDVLRHCFAVADDLLRHADRYVVNAIENVYLHCLHLDGSTRGNQLARQLMPVALYQAYVRPHTNMFP